MAEKQAEKQSEKQASKPLHITFHNPNTREETLRALILLAAQAAQAKVETALLHPQASEQLTKEDGPATELPMR